MPHLVTLLVIRLVICGCLVYSFFNHTLSKAEKYFVGGLAILYNPIFKVHLGSKELWIIAIITVVFIWHIHHKNKRF